MVAANCKYKVNLKNKYERVISNRFFWSNFPFLFSSRRTDCRPDHNGCQYWDFRHKYARQLWPGESSVIEIGELEYVIRMQLIV